MITVPPDPPEIQGYIEGETIRMGQTLSLTCVSYGGNPLATITWFRNGEMVDMSYTTSGRESRNMYTFVAQSEDNGARFSCEAKNEMSTETMKAEILLAVQCEYPFTMLQKFSKCEVKAAWCVNFTILLPLKFYVKSNFW